MGEVVTLETPLTICRISAASIEHGTRIYREAISRLPHQKHRVIDMQWLKREGESLGLLTLAVRIERNYV